MQRISKNPPKPQYHMPEHLKGLQAKEGVSLREFNFTSRSADIQAIPWDRITAIKVSDSGSTKVIMVETEAGSVVLKTSGEIGLDYFMNILAQVIEVPAPKMKILRYEEDEFTTLVNQIRQTAANDEILIHRIYQKFKVAFIEVMEFIPGLTIGELGTAKAKVAFSGRERLTKLGITLAFDVFLNNGDRYPLPVWRNDGNCDNLILQVLTPEGTPAKEMKDPQNLSGEFVNWMAIDHRMVLLAAKGSTELQDKVLDKYITGVETFIDQLCSAVEKSLKGEAEDFKCIECLKILIYNYTLYTIDDQGLLDIARGFINGMINLTELGTDGLIKIRDALTLNYDQDWCGNYNENLNRIHISFCSKMIELFTKYLEKYPALANDCKEYPLNKQIYSDIINKV